MTAACRFRIRPAALLEIAGRDREAFLQGQCTNDVLALAPGGVARAAALTPKGKLLADFRVAKRDRLRILSSGGAEALAAHLKKYAVFQEVRIDDRSADFALVELFGPPGTLPASPPGSVVDAIFQDVELEVWPPFFETGATWLLAAERAARVEAAVSVAAERISDGEAEALRIEAGRPEYGKDMDDSHLPDEIGMDDAISATKGCYVGQEIVARLRTYGRVNKRLVGFSFAGKELPAPGTVLVRRGQEEKEAGRVTSAAESPRFGMIGLGFATRDVSEGDVLSFRDDASGTARVEPKARP